ncbi:MAG: hypothetical protein IT435_00425 [Phycisphaerales bacterium]|nr:hypothetical protein [Phycisphaerales bacterium]
MKADYLTYRKATGVSILGLVLQTAQAVILLIYGILNRDQAAMTGGVIIGFGIPVWLGLAIVFDQHRRERLEAFEAEAIAASSGASNSVFDTGGEEFKVAARRLAGLHKFFLPGLSIFICIGLAVMAWLRFNVAKSHLAETDRHLTDPDGWGIAIGLTLAVIGFIFARFVSGMAKQAAWANLRGGAAYAVASSLIGLAIAVAHFVDYAGPDVIRIYLPIVLAGLMFIMAGEILLNLVLDLYRPRKPGQIPRPAFDSRILSFIAAPDRIAESISEAINYQLGFDVSSNWFYQLVSRRLGILVVVAIVVVWSLSALTVIQPHQRGMVLRFGQFTREMGPGLNLKLPWPLERVEIPEYSRKAADKPREILGYTTTGVRILDLGTPPPANTTSAILWTNDHVGEEVFQIVQPSRIDSASSARSDDPALRVESSAPAGAGLALVAVEIPMFYAVRDVKLFDSFAPPEMRDDMLAAVARRQIMQYLSHQSVDDIVGGDRQKLNAQIRTSVQAALDNLNPDPATGTPQGAGIDLLFVGITNAHPNKAVSQSFEKVVQADRNRESKIESARKDEIETLTKVVGSTELAFKISSEIQALEQMLTDKSTQAAIKDQELKIQQLLESAGGSAAELVAKAKAERWTRHMGERGRASRYAGQIAAYEASPLVFQAGEYFQALRAAMTGARVYIVNDKVADLRIQAELQDVDTGVGVFRDRSESPKDY